MHFLKKNIYSIQYGETFNIPSEKNDIEEPRVKIKLDDPNNVTW